MSKYVQNNGGNRPAHAADENRPTNVKMNPIEKRQKRPIKMTQKIKKHNITCTYSRVRLQRTGLYRNQFITK